MNLNKEYIENTEWCLAYDKTCKVLAITISRSQALGSSHGETKGGKEFEMVMFFYSIP